jgi:pimeloyl-ACP methyl ester carboxylesterase
MADTVMEYETERSSRQTPPGSSLWSSSTGCGCCPAAGTAGPRPSRKPATPRSHRVGPTIPRRSARCPATRGIATAPCPRSYDQFRFSFANAVSDDEAKQLYDEFSVPAPGAPLFQAAAANLNPWTEAKVDHENPDRGPMLIISGDKDHTVPPTIAEGSYKQERKNKGVTDIETVPNRGHALTIDNGWKDVAQKALDSSRGSSERRAHRVPYLAMDRDVALAVGAHLDE